MILVVDTATSEAILALGAPDGRLVGTRSWPVGHRHGETLLPALIPFLDEHGVRLADLTGIVVGTGPGAFTGLRVGIATAKGLAHALGLPIVGVSTAEALLTVAVDDGPAGARPVLLLPAGPNDRLVVRPGATPELLPGGSEADIGPGETEIAVDLEGRVPTAALEAGMRARVGVAAAILRLGAERLAAGRPDDLATLVPEYVSLPRGVRASTGEVAWSRGPR